MSADHVNLNDKGSIIVFAYSHDAVDVAFHAPGGAVSLNLSISRSEALALAKMLTRAVRTASEESKLDMRIVAKRS